METTLVSPQPPAPSPSSDRLGPQASIAPAAALSSNSKLQDVLHSVLILGATLGTDFIHSGKATNALGLALAGLEAVIQVIAAEQHSAS
ncbi:MAG TPA: hypothetical protein VFB14_14110 [Bryobacteraceae bacterium]|jgi:hypothetical protein|nr:hypothetical protein [Bryobacteraceae bacterium]